MDIKAATVYCATAENEGITPGARQDAINEICMQFPVDANEQLGDTIWQRDWPVTWPHLSVVPDNVRPHDLPHITHRFLHS
ncbi:MAG: hypothetical protein JWO07_781 [Candidatus Saccharibacteria bacterium]|nr:hypothetical protein [Candidatus Saccharibacteria bacterium]